MDLYLGSMRIQAFTFVLLLSFLIPSVVRPFSGVGNKGTDFWLALPGIYNGGPVTVNGVPLTLTWSLMITSDFNATGQVNIAGIGFSTAFSVVAGSATYVTLPLSAMDTVSDAVTSLGIQVTATQNVAVYGCEYQNRASESYLGFPVQALGTNYMVLAYPSDLSISNTEFTLVGTQNGTTVTIIPSVTVGSRLAGTPYVVSLNQGDVYQLQDANNGDDLTGTLLSATQPIGVWGVNSCADIPVSHYYCNPLFEQLWPVPNWGTTFVTIPLASRLSGDTFRFVASANATGVTVNGVLLALLNQGQVVQTILTGSSYITSNNPIYVAQYANSSSYDYATPSPTPAPGDPAMISIPPVNLFDNDYVFSSPMTVFTENYVNLFVPTGSTGSVSLDGVALPASDFIPIGASGYWGATIPLTPASHHLTSPQAFGTLLYGFGTADAYGNPAGVMFQTATPTLTPTPCGYPGNTCTPTPT
ncbi:MAG TPA: IgGFc-binding protein, partial [bacterium]